MKPGKRTLRRVFGIPLALALLSLVGLFSALFGDAWYDRLSWFALAVPAWISLRAFWGSRGSH